MTLHLLCWLKLLFMQLAFHRVQVAEHICVQQFWGECMLYPAIAAMTIVWEHFGGEAMS
jgi:hypothetical protein